MDCTYTFVVFAACLVAAAISGLIAFRSKRTGIRAGAVVVALAAVFVAVHSVWGPRLGGGEQAGAPGDEVPPVQKRTYQVINSLEYRGRGTYAQHAAGVMVQGCQRLGSERVAYHTAFAGDVVSHQDSAFGEVNSPPITCIRDVSSQRLVGGSDVMRSPAAVANAALRQAPGRAVPDGRTRRVAFRFRLPPEYPQALTYTVVGDKHRLSGVGEVVAMLATAPIEFQTPQSGAPVRGHHRVLCLTDAAMEQVLYYWSSFTAAASQGEAKGTVRIETVAYQLRNGRPIALKDADWPWLTERFGRLGLAKDDLAVRTDAPLPVWAAQAVLARDMADVVAGIAIEGKSNPVPLIAIGTVMTVDAFVSVGTAVAQKAGLIEHAWPGVLNLAGQGVGLGAARTYEHLSGSDTDEQTWQAAGGVAGDVIGLLNPCGVLDKTITAGPRTIAVAQRISGSSRAAAAAGRGLTRVAAASANAARYARGLAQSERYGRALRGVNTIVDWSSKGLGAKSILDGAGALAGASSPAQAQADTSDAASGGPRAGDPVPDPSPSPPDSGRPDTPQAGLQRYIRAMETGDEGLFLRSAYGPPAAKELAGSMFKMASAATRFQDAYLKAYGKDFQANTPVGGAADALRKFITDGRWGIDGDKATCTIPGTPARLQMVRRDGEWMVDMTPAMVNLPYGDRRKQDEVIKLFGAFASAFDEVRPRIGAPGWDARKVMAELDAALKRSIRRSGVRYGQ